MKRTTESNLTDYNGTDEWAAASIQNVWRYYDYFQRFANTHSA